MPYKACVNERARAAEHLGVIRSLMERATVYRAISAPTALIGGITALIASFYMLYRAGFFGENAHRDAFSTRDFVGPWLIVLLITISANTFFVWREAQRDHRPLFSPGLRLALRSILPSIFVAAAITYVSWRNPSDLEGPTVLGLTWIGCYGLALLATMNFAPRSLVILGRCFVFTSVIWLLFLSSPNIPFIAETRGFVGANFAMGLTFGLFHLIYAVCTWRPESGAAAEPIIPE